MKYKYGQELEIEHPFYGKQKIMIDDFLEGMKGEITYTITLLNIKNNSNGLSGCIPDLREINIDEEELDGMINYIKEDTLE